MRFLALIPFAAIVAACGAPTLSPIVVGHARGPSSTARTPTQPTTTTTTTKTTTQSELELDCVSAPIPIFSGAPQVVRMQIEIDRQDHATVVVAPGSQFWSHDGNWHTEDPGVTFETHAKRTSTSLSFAVNDDIGLDVTKKDRELAWRGTMTDEEQRDVVCWSNGDLFGEYGGGGSALPAHFDFNTDACIDADGNAALNEIPVEIVRETGFGECADLHGASLNGDDLQMPDLVGFNLVGAHLDGATLFFANLTSAALAGADLSGLDFGYASVTGYVDATTKLPDGCTVDDESNATCNR